jgi:aldehyde:ferredoxin oxidoreductase
MSAYRNKVLRIDLTNMSHDIEPIPRGWTEQYLGGRGFNIRRLYSEVPDNVDPDSPDNKLVIGVGPLNGTLFSGAARVNFSALSPATGILGDSNAGGFFGPELKFAGFDQVVIEGRSATPVYLFIHDGTVEIRDAAHLWGLDVWQTDAALKAEISDPRVQTAIAGPAAENKVAFAGIFCNLVRPAARTGMGTVLASKNVKAIAVRGKTPLRVHDPVRFRHLLEVINEQILEHPEYDTRKRLGTTKLVTALNKMGCLSTRHFQHGRFESYEKVSGEMLADSIKIKSKACFACNIPCSRFWRIEEGPYKGLMSEGPEFEALAGFSSRVGNDDLHFALAAVDRCNRLGMDVISASEVISFAMELYQRKMLTKQDTGGLELSWGNKECIMQLLTQIAYRERFGAKLAFGVRRFAELLGRGQELAMHVKGLEVFQADPRGLKAYALGYAVASRGGDHLRSEPSFEFCEDAEEAVRRFGVADAAFRLKYRGKGKVVKHYEERCAIADSLNACKNTIVNMEILPYEQAAELLHAAAGLDISAHAVQKIGERIVNLERAYIVRLGIRREHDTLPRRFLEEPLPAGSGESTGHVVELQPMLDEYYTARGWHLDTGIPTSSKLRELGLCDVEAEFSRRHLLF